MSSLSLNSIFLFVFIIFFISANGLSHAPSPTTNSLQIHLSYIQSLCKSTPYPETCFKTLKLSIDINIGPHLLNSLLQTLQTALSEATKISDLFYNGGYNNIIEKQKGTFQDCHELHQTTVSALKKSVSKMGSFGSRNVADARTFLSAALTNKITCLNGLSSASGSAKPTLLNSLDNAYKYVSNSLSLLSKTKGSSKGRKNRRLLQFPRWLSRKHRRILQDEYDLNDYLVVAADETGNFSTITDAINFAPNNSYDRVIIYVKQGIYEENVEIPSWKTNIVLIGDGAELTVITGKRSVADGWTTFRSATIGKFLLL
ncbi:hypothetical protein Leryth_027564 [Lithospermum erythrorhizon]|nr:hypothetical protein Leryth_027564 [Lithospermum erythrorhizon]